MGDTPPGRGLPPGMHAALTAPAPRLALPPGPWRWIALAALVGGLRCCGCSSPDDNLIDDDGDGYHHPDSVGACVFFETPPDCDDRDPAIHPGAEDPPGDGIDQDCDGVDGRAADAAPP